MSNEPKPVTEKDDLLSQINDAFGAPAAGNTSLVPVSGNNVPAVVMDIDLSVAAQEGGGLSYRTATPEERAEMDQIIASIDLQNSETIIALGQVQRDKLSKLADETLDSLDPSVKLNFVEALKGLVDAVRANSLDEMKKKIQDGVVGRLMNIFRSSGMSHKEMVEKVKEFSTNITAARKVIREMVDKLEIQKGELVKNYDRINALGREFSIAGQEMRVVRAATAEYIRRVSAGENTELADLARTAQQTGRKDDQERLQTGVAGYKALFNMDTELLSSIAVYDMNVASMAFTKEANIQNRAQTAVALSTAVSRWKSQLAVYSVMMVEKTAQELLGGVDALNRQSIKNGVELFEQLVDMTVSQSATGKETMRTIMDGEAKVVSLLEKVGERVEADFAERAAEKKQLEASMSHFTRSVVNVYASNPAGLLAVKPKASGDGPAPNAP